MAKMWNIFYIYLCSCAVAVAGNEVPWKGDRPYLKVAAGDQAELTCCDAANRRQLKSHWIQQTKTGDIIAVQPSEGILIEDTHKSGRFCGKLLFKNAYLNNTGMYHCYKNNSGLDKSHGTYLHVYRTLDKTLKLSEKTKNRILIVEGFLLLVSVLLPSFTLLCKSKRLKELEKKKALKEEENIYQGLTLDDRSSTYDQIERSQNHGPYQDVCNTLQDDIQLEKP